MYCFADEIAFKYSKPASEIVMPFFLRVVREELGREKLKPTGRCIGQVAAELKHRTYQQMLHGGFPNIAMGMLMSGWLSHFVSSCILAVQENLEQARRKGGVQ